jgi:hypothetical protein
VHDCTCSCARLYFCICTCSCTRLYLLVYVTVPACVRECTCTRPSVLTVLLCYAQLYLCVVCNCTPIVYISVLELSVNAPKKQRVHSVVREFIVPVLDWSMLWLCMRKSICAMCTARDGCMQLYSPPAGRAVLARPRIVPARLPTNLADRRALARCTSSHGRWPASSRVCIVGSTRVDISVHAWGRFSL